MHCYVSFCVVGLTLLGSRGLSFCSSTYIVSHCYRQVKGVGLGGEQRFCYRVEAMLRYDVTKINGNVTRKRNIKNGLTMRVGDML